MSGLFGDGGSSPKVSAGAPALAGLRIQTSAYSRAVTVLFGTTRVTGNLIDYDDFTAIVVPSAAPASGGGGGKGGDSGGASTPGSATYRYTSMVLIALCHGPIAAVGNIWRDKDQGAFSDFFTDLFPGSSSQTAWSFLSTNHPAKAITYRNLAYAANAVMDLGNSANLGNFSFEVKRLTVDYGLPDAAVKDVITEVVTNPLYGLGLPGGILGNYTALHNYCGANNIWVSPAYTDREPAADTLNRLANIANAGPFWSEDLLKIVPYGDTAITANGFTFTPNLTPEYDLGDADYLDKDQPVHLIRKTPADLFNQVTGKFFNRNNQYNEEPVEYKDQADIELNGLKSDPNERTYHEIALPASAQAVVDAEGRRGLYGLSNVYEVRVTARYDLLEPMDLVTITDAALQLDRQLVRIRSIEEDSEETLLLTVEEVTVGTASPALYATQSSGGHVNDFNADPGLVNTPVLLDMPAVITDSGFELGIAVSGASPLWGGANVWVATDSGGPYKWVGLISGPARYGVLSAPFAAGSDPDTTHTLSVDLTLSKGVLSGGAQADADNLSTLSWIERELVSFETATLTATSKYDLKDYIRRGVFNTATGAHAAAERFVRMDSAVFRYPYDPSLIGKTLYIKLPSFNIYGGAPAELATATAYAYTIVGPIGAPDAPTGFTVQQAGAVLNFRVDPVKYLQLDRVEIRYADAGETQWNNGVPVTNILRGNTDSNGSVPPGTWRFMARSYDLAGNPSKTFSIYDLTVTAEAFSIIAQRQDAPDWFGTITNFVVTWSGALIPKSTHVGNFYAGNEWIDQFVPDPYPTCTYEAPEIDKQVDSPARIWADIVSVLGPGVLTGTASPGHQIDYRLEAGAYTGFQPWTIGKPNFRRLKSRLVLDTTIGLAKITGFRTVIDKEPIVEEKHGLPIPPTGLVVTYDNLFHLTPGVTAYNDGGTPLLPVHTGDTRTGTNLQLWNTAAPSVQVGGTGGYRATGV